MKVNFLAIILAMAGITSTSCARISAEQCRQCTTGARRYLHRLCEIEQRALTKPWSERLAAVQLPQAQAPPLTKVGEAPLLVLRGRTLSVDGTPYKVWSKILQQVAPRPKKPRRRPGRKHASATVGFTTPSWAMAWEIGSTLPQAPRARKVRRRPPPRRRPGMLRTLSRMNKKLGTMFSRDSAVSAKDEAALLVLLGLKRHRKKIREALGRARRAKRPRAVVLAIGSDVPALGVSELLRLLYREKYREVSFLVVRPRPVIPAPPRASAAAPSLSQELSRWRKEGCAAVLSVYQSAGSLHGVARCRKLHAALPVALSSCRCAVDEKPLLRLAHSALRSAVFVGAHRVTLVKGAKSVHLKKSHLRWGQVVARVLVAKPKRFWLDGPRFPRTTIGARGAGYGGWGGFHKGKGGKGGGYGLGGRGFGVGKYKSRAPKTFLKGLKVTGGLTSKTVRGVMRRHLSEVKYCYMSLGLPDNPKLKGKVMVSYTIGLKGLVTRVSIAKTTLGHKKTETCIVSAHRRWRFPKPKGKPAHVLFTYTFKIR